MEAALLGGVGLLLSYCCFPIGLPLDIAAIICGYVASGQIKQGKGTGHGLAVGGLALGIAGIVLFVALLAFGRITMDWDAVQRGEFGPPVERNGVPQADPSID
ncbi:DUF4190 domain-containing protein [Alienimonas sp. DA493]|uniref:DUF4190 domain-containing protein n=1 Tax=Alienimonas sp. DA493 TaxID=3373605 RepID=UPI003754689A